MGSWDKTHLLFSDANGENNADTLLFGQSALNFTQIYSRPFLYLRPGQVLRNQNWYWVSGKPVQIEYIPQATVNKWRKLAK